MFVNTRAMPWVELFQAFSLGRGGCVGWLRECTDNPVFMVTIADIDETWIFMGTMVSNGETWIFMGTMMSIGETWIFMVIRLYSV